MSNAVVDSDFYAQRADPAAIAEYMDSGMRAYLRPEASPAGGGVSFAIPEGGIRTLTSRLQSAAAAGDLHERATHYLDSARIACAILNPGTAGGLSGFTAELVAAELQRATNDWLAAEWLDTDARYRGSILVTARDAKLAAAEIRRVAADRRFVQVILAYPPNLLGDHSLRPILEAAQECGLPLNLQAAGAWSGVNRGIAAVGYPASPLEDQLGWTYAAQPHLVSMIVRGAFDRYPELRLVLGGFGIAWLPALLWRMDTEAKAGRLDASIELSRLPSEYVRERVRFTTQPLELPDDRGQFFSLLEGIGGGDLLVYGSGHPQWRDTDAGTALQEALPEEWKAGVLSENARRLYDLQAVAQAPR